MIVQRTAPAAATVKVAVWPVVTVTPAGSAVIEGWPLLAEFAEHSGASAVRMVARKTDKKK